MYRNFICRTDVYSATGDRWWCHVPNENVCATQIVPMRIRRSVGGAISRERSYPLSIYWQHSKGIWLRYNFAADSFYIMKLCSRLFVLYCRSCPKDDKSRYFDPHFEEVRGGIEPWLIARWKARVEFLLRVTELLFVSLTVEALQGKTCQDSLLSGEGRSLAAKTSGGRGRPWGIFFGFCKTRHILLYDSAKCTALRAVVLTKYRRVTDRRTDRRTDGRTDRRRKYHS